MAEERQQVRDPEPAGTVVGILAEYAHPGALLEAAKACHREGFRRFDTHTPFPIHGMDKAMGLKQSSLGFLVLGGGLTGMGLAVLMHWWMGGVDYPLWISGMPFFAWESSIPITFEVTILFAALTAVAGMLALNRLPRPYNPLFNSEEFTRFSDDAFFLFVDARDLQFDPDTSSEFLRKIGAIRTEVIREHED